jgi:hypothetical protein
MLGYVGRWTTFQQKYWSKLIKILSNETRSYVCRALSKCDHPLDMASGSKKQFFYRMLAALLA